MSKLRNTNPAPVRKGKIRLDGHSLGLEDLREIAEGRVLLSVASKAKKEVQKASQQVAKAAEGARATIWHQHRIWSFLQYPHLP